MKVKLLTSISGPAGAFNVGEEYTCVDAAEAKRFIDAGFAEAIKEKAKKVETATKKIPEVEKAVK